jgi:integrase
MCRLKDIPPVRFHELRHSHVTQLLAAGLRPRSRKSGCHSTIATTMDIYSPVTARVHEDAATKVDVAYRA